MRGDDLSQHHQRFFMPSKLGVVPGELQTLHRAENGPRCHVEENCQVRLLKEHPATEQAVEPARHRRETGRLERKTVGNRLGSKADAVLRLQVTAIGAANGFVLQRTMAAWRAERA